MKIFVIIPPDSEFYDIYELIDKAAIESGHSVISVNELINGDRVVAQIHQEINDADLIIADLTNRNPNVMYELGYAHSLSKPICLISQLGKEFPFDMRSVNVFFYERSRLNETLYSYLRKAFTKPDFDDYFGLAIMESNKKQDHKKTVFVSYSHKDKEYLERLQVHLKPFEKSGIIDLWADTKIKTGQKWQEKIEEALNKSAIAILMVSADFLASDFIIDNELPPLLKAAKENGKHIVQVILKPCRFHSYPNLNQFQAINDPKNPMSKMDDNEREETFVEIADHIHQLTS